MKHLKWRIFIVALMVSTSVLVTSCKGKNKESSATSDTSSVSSTPGNTAPVEVAGDEALTTGVTDATKDYPGVVATVSNGEITLTGEVQRSRLPNLMQSLNSLKPKKINNNLKIK